MVNYYKYAAVFLLIWRLIDFCFLILFDDVYSVTTQRQEEGEPLNKIKQAIVELEEKIERVDLVLKNLE